MSDTTGGEIHPELRRARRGGIRMVTSLLSKDDPELVSQTIDALQEMTLQEYDETFAAMDGYNLVLKLAEYSNTKLKNKAVELLLKISPPGKLDVDETGLERLIELLGKEEDLTTKKKVSSAIARISVYEDSWSGGNIVRSDYVSIILSKLKESENYYLIHTVALLTECDEVRVLPVSELSIILDAFSKLSIQQQEHLLPSLLTLYQQIPTLPIQRLAKVIVNFLSSSDKPETIETAATILKLICGANSSHEIQSVIIGPLVGFLTNNKNENLLEISLSLLEKLSICDGVTEEMLETEAVKKLLTILNSNSPAKNKEICKTLLKRIVEEPENKIRIVEAGDLGELLSSVPKDIAEEILSALSFEAFVERGNLPLDIAQQLIEYGVDPSVNDNATIIHACTNGMTEIVALLLRDPRVDPSANRDTPLRMAASKGHVEILQMLLMDERVSPSAAGNSAIITACENGHYEVFRLLFADPRVDAQYSLLLSATIQGGNPRILEDILKVPDLPSLVNLSIIDPLALAIQWHHRRLVEIILDCDPLRPLLNPACHDNLPLLWAARNGFTEIVELLLCDPRVDPCTGDNAALKQAVVNNHSEIVDVLLKDHRPDPSFEENFLIRTACTKGFTAIARLLLDDPRVDPSAHENIAIRIAAKKGYDALTEELLAHDLVDPSDARNEAIISAASEGHTNIVRMLCHDPRVDPSARYNQALKEASEKGWVEIVEILSHDERVDPSVGNLEVVKRALEADTIQDKEALWKNFASQYALKHNHPKIATLVETDPRASPAFLWNYAINNKNVDFVKLLLNDERIKEVHIKNAFSIASKKGDFDIMELLLQADNCDISLKEVGKSIATGFTMMRKRIDSLEVSLDDLYEGQEKLQKKMDTLVDLLTKKQ